jgi:hypothetical protein
MKSMKVWINMMMLGALLALTVLVWSSLNAYAGVPASGEYLRSGIVQGSGAVYILAKEPPPHKRADDPTPPRRGDDPPPHG